MRLKGSLKTRLVAITLMALLPAVMIITTNIWYQFSQEKERVGHRAYVFTKTLLENQLELISSTEFFLKAISGHPQVQNPRSNECKQAVKEWLTLNPYIVNIGIPLANGNLFCNATEMSRTVNVSDRIYFQQAIQGRKFSAGQFQQDRAAGVASINFAYPVFNKDKQVIAAAVAVLSLEWWHQRLTTLELPKDAIALIVDANKKVIASDGEDYSADLSRLFAGEEVLDSGGVIEFGGVMEYIDSASITRLVVSMPLIINNTDTKAHFVVSLSTEESYKIARQAALRAVVSLVVGYGVFIALLWWGFASNVLKPVYALLNASKRYIERFDSKKSPSLDELSVFYRQFTQVIREQERLTNTVIENERQLSTAYQRLNNLLDNSPFGVVEWDPNLRIQRWSAECEHVFGVTFEQVHNREINQLDPNIKQHFWAIESFLKLYRNGKSSTKTSEVTFKNDLNTEKVLRWRFSAIYDDSEKLLAILGMFENVTQQVEYQRELEYYAKYDSLTGLPNRYSILQYLSERIIQNHHFSIVLLDIKNFKMVNDHYGHEYGDMLLVELAERMNLQLQRGELLSRWGGNEFIYTIPYTAQEEVINRVEELRSKLALPLTLGNGSYATQFRCGISSTDNPYETAGDLIRCADLAIYFAKKNTSDPVNFYHPSMSEIGSAQFELEAELRTALRNQEFELYYQPIKSNESGLYESAEALIRWNHPTRGMVSPAEFIPVAEESGLILLIGDWVLEKAIAQMKEWHTSGVMLKDIAVNLSALQLNDAKIVSQVKSLCEQYQLSPDLLTLEVTETSLLSSHTDVVSKIKELKNFGIKIALDDFGTGYSSLSYLNELPLTKLKIDRSFVAKVGRNDNEMLLDAIFSIAHGLNLSVIAEGVETQNQFDYIVARQCEYSQGYLFSKPVPSSELESILRQEMSLG